MFLFKILMFGKLDVNIYGKFYILISIDIDLMLIALLITLILKKRKRYYLSI